METFAPEFAQYWLGGQAGDADAVNPDGDNHDTASEQAALVELADRVSAARTVI
jgi:hypothetical protein